jgi:hypothetical protein
VNALKFILKLSNDSQIIVKIGNTPFNNNYYNCHE